MYRQDANVLSERERNTKYNLSSLTIKKRTNELSFYLSFFPHFQWEKYIYFLTSSIDRTKKNHLQYIIRYIY
jgi:hypothetical protein